MSRAFVICSALCACVSMIYADNLGIGIWDGLAINKCGKNNHKFKYDLTLVKINETHDGFKGQVVMEEDFTNELGVRLEICKYVDDKWKRFQVMTEDSMVDFLNRYAKDKVTDCLIAAGVDPPETPIQKGTYDIDNYVIAKEPGIGMYGIFNIKLIVLQGEEDVGCLEFELGFKKMEEDNEEEGNEEEDNEEENNEEEK